jgi:cytochrome c556
MNLRLISSLLPLALIASAPLLRAQDNPPPGGPPAQEEKTALEKDMDQIGRAMRTLKKQISDSTKNDASIALVAKIHDAATAALDETPAKAQDLPEADRPKFIADYQAGMKAFIADVDKLTAALQAGDNATAATLFAQLGSDEKQDHKQFRKPKKD